MAQLIKDFSENAEDVNKQLDRIGYNIGIRLVEDFLAKTSSTASSVRCLDMKDVADRIQTAFKLYFGSGSSSSGSLSISKWSRANDEFSILIDPNPLTEFVELPDTLRGSSSQGTNASGGSNQNCLKYSNIYCGMIRGALEMVQIEVQTWFLQDSLRGDPTTEIRVKFIRKLVDALPAGES